MGVSPSSSTRSATRPSNCGRSRRVRSRRAARARTASRRRMRRCATRRSPARRTAPHVRDLRRPDGVQAADDDARAHRPLGVPVDLRRLRPRAAAAVVQRRPRLAARDAALPRVGGARRRDVALPPPRPGAQKLRATHVVPLAVLPYSALSDYGRPSGSAWASAAAIVSTPRGGRPRTARRRGQRRRRRSVAALRRLPEVGGAAGADRRSGGGHCGDGRPSPPSHARAPTPNTSRSRSRRDGSRAPSSARTWARTSPSCRTRRAPPSSSSPASRTRARSGSSAVRSPHRSR